MLRRLLTSKTRVKLLTLFLMNPEREMYIREIVRITNENIDEPVSTMFENSKV